jgi:hypothetical protein
MIGGLRRRSSRRVSRISRRTSVQRTRRTSVQRTRRSRRARRSNRTRRKSGGALQPPRPSTMNELKSLYLLCILAQIIKYNRGKKTDTELSTIAILTHELKGQWEEHGGFERLSDKNISDKYKYDFNDWMVPNSQPTIYKKSSWNGNWLLRNPHYNKTEKHLPYNINDVLEAGGIHIDGIEGIEGINVKLTKDKYFKDSIKTIVKELNKLTDPIQLKKAEGFNSIATAN